MEKKKEPIADFIISDTDADALREIFDNSCADSLCERIDTLFEAALWGEAHSQSDSADFKRYHYHFGYLREVKKALMIIDKAIVAERAK